MFRYLIFTAVIFLLAPLPGLGQQGDDQTAVQQVFSDPGPGSDPATTDQLNKAMTRFLQGAQIEQLKMGPDGVGVQQAEGGTDLCAPGPGPRYNFCDKQVVPKLAAEPSKRVARPEEDLAAGSQAGIERFSSDPSLTAEQIGRGTAESFAAQAFADEMFNRKKSNEETELPALTEGLPPEVLTDFGGGPVITEGN